MSLNAPVITIDGPSGSGKGTVAGLLAKQLGWNLLDSGALYRLLAFCAGNHGVDLANEESLKLLAAHLDVQLAAADGSRFGPRWLDARTVVMRADERQRIGGILDLGSHDDRE